MIEAQRDYAVLFVASLPQVFGESLDRMTLWDRIGTALEVAYAKTVGDDTDFFISAALEHILAAPSDVSRCEGIAACIEWLHDCTSEEKHAWLAYLSTHRYAVLVRARAKWEARKEMMAEIRSNGDA